VQVALYGKDLEITPALRAYAEKRLGKLQRYFPDGEVTAQVTLSVQRQEQRVEVTMSVGGWIVRAEEAAPSMYAAIDLVLEKLERQVHKYKTRLIRNPRHGREPIAPDGGADAAAEVSQVVRSKEVLLKPMSLEEAILQMELVGHDFFLFRDGDGTVRVLYRRREGGLGLLTAR
jgi:putative sigma-54 modulation protein